MGEAAATGLRRLARPAPPADPPTPARALRQAFARAADRASGLPVAVLGVAEDQGPLDALLARFEPDLLLLGVERGGIVGVIGLDAEARAAVVETATRGRPVPQPAEPRPATAVDAALALPLARAFLEEAEAGSAGTPLAGWIGAARVGAHMPSPREAGLALPDGAYRVVRLTLDLGVGGRQGLALLLLPVAAARAPEAGPSWSEGLSARVLGAGLPVTAVLHRLRLPLAEAEGLAPGDVIALPGVTVASVRLEGPGGADMGTARLGQVAGQRAIRIEAAAALALSGEPVALAAAGPGPSPPS